MGNTQLAYTAFIVLLLGEACMDIDATTAGQSREQVKKPSHERAPRLHAGTERSSSTLEKRVAATVLEKLKPTLKQFRRGINKKGFIYTRWGSSRCPRSATVIYSGFMAGAHYSHGGSGANHLCMPLNAIYVPGVRASRGGYIYSSKYVCSVCHSSDSTEGFLMPARNRCPKNWGREYYGYLMSSHYTHTKGDYICMDRAMETVAGQSQHRKGHLVYSVQGPYKRNRPLTCAICAK